LGVALDEGDVGEAFVGASLPRPLEHPRGEVDPGDVAVERESRRVAARAAGAAPDIQHAIGGPDQLGVKESLPNLVTGAVVPVSVLGPDVTLVPVPRVRLLCIDHVDAHNAPVPRVCSHREYLIHPKGVCQWRTRRPGDR